MSFKKFLNQVSCVVLFTLISVASSAAVITIEPDDYPAGTDLSNISPYVTLQSRSYVVSGDTVVSPVYAGLPLYDGLEYPAPTGDLTFGNYSWEPVGSSGFGMAFHQEVNHVSLLAVSAYPRLGVQWGAFGFDGQLMATGLTAGGGYGETFLVDISLDGIWALVVGGHTGINAIDFDRLTFDVADSVTVPEPGMLPLFAGSLLLLGLRRRAAQA